MNHRDEGPAPASSPLVAPQAAAPGTASLPEPAPPSRKLLAAAGLVVVIAGLKAAKAVFVPGLFAFFLAILSFPLLFWLRRHRVPRWLAVTLTVLAVLVILSVVGLVLSGSLDEVGTLAPTYVERLTELARPGIERLSAYGLDLSTWVADEALNLDRVIELTANTFAGLATAVSFSFLVPLILVFILLEALGFPHKLNWALGRDTDLVERFGKITREVQGYLVIKTAISLGTGLTVGVGVWLLGLDFPLFWGFVAFVFNFIPNIGSVLAAVPAVLLALVQLGLTRALLVAGLYVLINLVLGNLIEPNLMGRRLSLSPLVVLLSLLFWGWVWGPVGMLLSVPLTMVGKILLENTERYAWVAKLLAHPTAARAAVAPAGAAPGPVAPGQPAPRSQGEAPS